MKIISIGILAHNESDSIAALIGDMGRETIFRNEDISFSIHIVANGCKDDTGDVASKALEAPAFQLPNIRGRVHELPQAGKANAWNKFIHSFADQNSDFVFLVDADIRLLGDTTLSLMLDSLMASPDALIAVDEPVKDVALKAKKSLMDRLILSFSRTTHDFRSALAGSLYCARFETVRNIWIPTGIIGEDGFLRAMILTSNFTEQETTSRLIFVEGARHSFETRRNLRDIWHHQVRLAIGTGLNVLLFAHLREQLKRMGSIELYIKTRNEDDPRWLNSLIVEEMRKERYLVMDRGFVGRRLRFFRLLPLASKFVKFPVYILATALDVIVFLAANRVMRKGAAVGFW